MDGQREARKRELVDVQMEKGKKDEHLKLLTMLCTILIYINCKTLFKNGNVAIFSNNPFFQLLTSN